ncbi:ead/Ea22-like family protein [Enterobacter roggenkampii]|uniref:ead/Ea22-like family protein n=1 Tax=Enterobacter roggenkampii TaxID=1812935 RepID=UPI0020037773|nr:ead/Ea22-like family protein [Enterobacter roggenkampii]MCK6943194.1 ead/Ea22-like family protein [Enterobacter roggenkampii]
MSNIDKRALREAAEKATKGQWAVEFDDEIYSTDGVNHEQIAMVFSENEARDAAFIAAANPATVLALLDELEPMALAHFNLNLLCDVYRTAYEEARHDGLVNWEAAASLAEENGDLKRKLDAAEKRIAELEAVKCKLSDSKLLSLAKDIVENLVDTGGSDPEYTKQYVDWTRKRIRVAAAAKGE